MSVAQTGEGQPLVSASVWQRPVLTEAEQVTLARRRANAATALLLLGQEEAVWPLLRDAKPADVRSFLVRDLAARGVDARAVVKRLEGEADAAARRALILALGEYTLEQLPQDVRADLEPRLLEWYRSDPDPGVHGAIDWLLRHDRQGPDPRKLDWTKDDVVRGVDRSFMGLLRSAFGPEIQLSALQAADRDLRGQGAGDRHWFVSETGQTFAIIPGPVEFTMGSPNSEPGRHPSETLHQRRIPRSYAIATKKVTVYQWHRFLRDVQTRYPGVINHTYGVKYSPDATGPILAVNWYDAAMYCRWLSEQEHVPEDQMCYPEIPKIKPGMALPKNYLSRTGYRMPTQAEWEYACRGGADTSRFFGNSDDLLGNYAWYVKNSNDRAWPVGELKPNDFGLFDILGNAFERIQEYGPRPATDGGVVVDTETLQKVPALTEYAYMRGGTYSYIAAAVRSAAFVSNLASARPNTDGLRVARTWP
jgi:formylglycine-generating enzyme required for sulfatase activity